MIVIKFQPHVYAFPLTLDYSHTAGSLPSFADYRFAT